METLHDKGCKSCVWTCGCGLDSPHIVAKRSTFDGVTLQFWNDGAITHGRSQSYVIRGSRGGKLQAAKDAAAKVAENASIYDLAEIFNLAKTCRTAAEKG